MIRALILAFCLLAGTARADLAKDASAMLLDAAVALDAAKSEPDRIAALTETVRAYETGLSAMREGLVGAKLEQRELTAKLAEEDADLGAMLALMQKASAEATTEALVHPEGAIQTIRAGMLASMLVPALHGRADALNADLTRLKELIALQEAGAETLEEGLAGVREARLALSRAVGERDGKLPPKISTDEAAIQALINSSETLSAFADDLLAESGGEGEMGGWALPVRGEIVSGYNEKRIDGRARPGWTVMTGAEALVTAPADATVRFSGELPGQGTVAILEPKGGALIILAGLATSFVSRDQVVAENDPIGFMGPGRVVAQEKLNAGDDGSSLHPVETLYIEIRQGRKPVDPAKILVKGQE